MTMHGEGDMDTLWLRQLSTELRRMAPVLRRHAAEVDADTLSPDVAGQLRRAMHAVSVGAESMADDVDVLAASYQQQAAHHTGSVL
ncbi:hypothetical protein MOQ72_37220 [Saccharopolyspora sp. K220]|uniref:hypothetical protein n=1 Tax=Saccharopolyspora soli TaxID=2926618 RepID=UPI001F57953B|nr:hypothetical protein [Saccharopolyspora soli]MCI2423074.1 hypothetical protein [Saccharopolyspora soli]